MSDLQQQLEEEVQAHNDVHAQIQQGEEQLAALRVERDRRYGRVTVLQELIQAEKGEDALPEDVAGSE